MRDQTKAAANLLFSSPAVDPSKREPSLWTSWKRVEVDEDVLDVEAIEVGSEVELAYCGTGYFYSNSLPDRILEFGFGLPESDEAALTRFSELTAEISRLAIQMSSD